MTQQQDLKTGGSFRVLPQTLLCLFDSPRSVLSTSLYNGGFLEADAIFNHQLSFFVTSEQDLPGGSLEKYLGLTAIRHNLAGDRTTGLLTSASMSCHAYSSMTYKDLTVEVIATAGVKQNAARAGDPACYYEHQGKYQSLGGTINILAMTNVHLPYGAMAKALISITEAKTAALQELAVTSPFTRNPATGTGTDGMIIAADPNSAIFCKDTGTQSKLGELFCTAVKTAVTQSLAFECHCTPMSQGSLSGRLSRLDVTLDAMDNPADCISYNVLLSMTQSVWQEYCWGLLNRKELDYYLTLLQMPALQPAGAKLAALLQTKCSTHFLYPVKPSTGRLC